MPFEVSFPIRGLGLRLGGVVREGNGVLEGVKLPVDGAGGKAEEAVLPVVHSPSFPGSGTRFMRSFAARKSSNSEFTCSLLCANCWRTFINSGES